VLPLGRVGRPFSVTIKQSREAFYSATLRMLGRILGFYHKTVVRCILRCYRKTVLGGLLRF
jgi:hypothetical protein